MGLGFVTLALSFSIALISAPSYAQTVVTYEVPATHATPATFFTLDQAGINTDSLGTRALQFQLPPDLVGIHPENISLSEVKSAAPQVFSFFTDGKISASCQENADGSTCVLNYPKDYLTNADTSGVQDFLSKKFANDPDRLIQSGDLMVRFHSDPQGVIRILMTH